MELDSKYIQQILFKNYILRNLKVSEDIFSSENLQNHFRIQIRQLLKENIITFMKLHERQNQKRKDVKQILQNLDIAFRTKKKQFLKILAGQTIAQIYLPPKLKKIQQNFQNQFKQNEQDFQDHRKQKILCKLLQRQRIKVSLKSLIQLLIDDQQRQLMNRQQMEIVDNFVQFLQKYEFDHEYSQLTVNLSQISRIQTQKSSQFQTSEVQILKQLNQSEDAFAQLKINKTEQNLIKKKKLFQDNNLQEIYEEQTKTKKSPLQIFRQKNERIKNKISEQVKSQIKFSKIYCRTINEQQNFQINQACQLEKGKQVQISEQKYLQNQIQIQEFLSYNQLRQSLFLVRQNQIQVLIKLISDFQNKLWKSKLNVKVYGSLQTQTSMSGSNINIDIGCNCLSNKICRTCFSDQKVKKNFLFKFRQYFQDQVKIRKLQYTIFYDQKLQIFRVRNKRSKQLQLIQNCYITVGGHEKVQFSTLINQLYLSKNQDKKIVNFLKTIVWIFKKQKIILNINQLFAEPKIKDKAIRQQNQLTVYSVQMMCLFFLVQTRQIKPFQNLKQNGSQNEVFQIIEKKQQQQQIFVLNSVYINVIQFLNFFRGGGKYQKQYAKKRAIDIRKHKNGINFESQKYHLNIVNPIYPSGKGRRPQKYNVRLLDDQSQKSKQFYQKIKILYQKTKYKHFKIQTLTKETKKQQI